MVQKICSSPIDRRAIRPIDREKMKPWLLKKLDAGTVSGIEWLDRDRQVFRVTWRHASHHQYDSTNDANIFKCWAEHTGKFKSGDIANPKKWKANFRCALHSLKNEIIELKDQSVTRGGGAVRYFQFLDKKISGKTDKKLKLKKSPRYKVEHNSDDDSSSNHSSCSSSDYDSISMDMKEFTDIPCQGRGSIPDFAKIDSDLDIDTKHVKSFSGGSTVLINKSDQKICMPILLDASFLQSIQSASPSYDHIVPRELFHNTEELSFEASMDDCIDAAPLILESDIEYLHEVVLGNGESYMEDDQTIFTRLDPMEAL